MVPGEIFDLRNLVFTYFSKMSTKFKFHQNLTIMIMIIIIIIIIIIIRYLHECGPGSSVGIATGYGLDGPGSNPGGDEIFRPSRPALGPTQHPVQCVPDLSRG